jgi:hypothetical protein
LDLVREVVPASEGLHTIKMFGDVIFVFHPHLSPTIASIIHTENPSRVVDLAFNPDNLIMLDAWATPAVSSSHSIECLIPLSNPATSQADLKGTLAIVSGEERDPSVRFDDWKEYANLRVEGTPGGPISIPPMDALIRDKYIAENTFLHFVAIESAPLPVQDAGNRANVEIVAATDHYFVLNVVRTVEDANTKTTRVLQQSFFHKRPDGPWKVLQLDGDARISRFRIFGSWLATIAGFSNPSHKPGPGRESESNEMIDTYTSVKHLYGNFYGYLYFSPGRLSLQNLDDGRRIVIDTRQEDSEILWIGTDEVLYRVNDTIFQARIVGEKLREPSVIVEDEQVPEIHWAFWGPAQ